MDIKTSKIELVKLILDIENEAFIQRVTKFISDEKSDFWEKLTPSEKEEIKKGIAQLNRGERTSYKDVLKKIS
ncbi:MAG: hypothetical protein WBG71_05980 [Leeuwenhoekiella sp.]